MKKDIRYYCKENLLENENYSFFEYSKNNPQVIIKAFELVKASVKKCYPAATWHKVENDFFGSKKSENVILKNGKFFYKNS